MAVTHVRFDWAIKRLLRDKANFDILEGFLSVVLKEDIKIKNLLESEGNQAYKDDKYNRVDILVENSQGELMLVEVQNNSEIDYFHRMLYGVSKLITEYIKQGEPYGAIKKVFSFNIVYFGLGQGLDYVYEGSTSFTGLHKGDTLMPSYNQIDEFAISQVQQIFPRYWIFRINGFQNVAKTPLDEWIYFLKNSEIPQNFKAKGLNQAREKLKLDQLSDEEKKAYQRFLENRRIEKSELHTARKEGEKRGEKRGEKKGKQKAQISIAKMMKNNGESLEKIAQYTGLSQAEIQAL